MSERTGRMSAKEFRETGLLQEINRQWLHPRGLALEVVVDVDGTERFGEVWDDRDDSEGWVFADSVSLPENSALAEMSAPVKGEARMAAFGWVVQPAGWEIVSHPGVWAAVASPSGSAHPQDAL